MPRPRHHSGSRQAAEALVRTAPLVSRWIERLLVAHDPPLTVAQYLALEAVAEGEMVGAELARRAAVSPAAVSHACTIASADTFPILSIRSIATGSGGSLPLKPLPAKLRNEISMLR